MDSRRLASTFQSEISFVFYFFNLGSSGDVIVGHFAVSYHNEAAQLGIDLEELYQAQWTDGEVNPPEWNIEGRQVNVYKYGCDCCYPGCDLTRPCRQFGYVPFAVLDVSSTGRQTREGSRTLEVSSMISTYS